MYSRLINSLFVGLLLAVPAGAQSPASPAADGCENKAVAKAQRIDPAILEAILRAEQRADALQDQLFEIEMEKLDLQIRIDELAYRMAPDSIQQALALVGSTRPMDELRQSLRTRIESERDRVVKQLDLLASRAARLETAISRADAEVERLRQRLSIP
jgi:predicted  nucleic acid-binding Zn-ribbon protein